MKGNHLHAVVVELVAWISPVQKSFSENVFSPGSKQKAFHKAFAPDKKYSILQIQETNTNDSIWRDLGNALSAQPAEMKTALSGSQTEKKGADLILAATHSATPIKAQ